MKIAKMVALTETAFTIYSLDIDVFLDFCKKSLNPIGLSVKKQVFVSFDAKKEYIGIVILFDICVLILSSSAISSLME